LSPVCTATRLKRPALVGPTLWVARATTLPVPNNAGVSGCFSTLPSTTGTGASGPEFSAT
jgi:hypothetical protein